jgi:hypothetical protein
LPNLRLLLVVTLPFLPNESMIVLQEWEGGKLEYVTEVENCKLHKRIEPLISLFFLYFLTKSPCSKSNKIQQN